MSNAIVDKVKNIMDIVCHLSIDLCNPITEKDYVPRYEGALHRKGRR